MCRAKRMIRLSCSPGLVGVLSLGGPAAAQCAGTALFSNESTTVVEAFVREGDTMLVELVQNAVPRGRRLTAYGLDRAGTPEVVDDRWIEIADLRWIPEGEGWFLGTLALAGTTVLAGVQPLPQTVPAVVEWYERLDGGTPDDPWDDTWVQRTSLECPHPGLGSTFGTAIALAGGTAVVGAPSDAPIFPIELPEETWGAAYVFERDDPGTPADPLDDAWILAQTLLPPPDYASFGMCLAQQEDMLLVSSRTSAGASADPPEQVFVFGRDASGTLGDPWVALGGLRAAGAPSESFGMSVAMSGDLALVGAPQFPTAANGKAYVFQRTDPGTPTDPLDDVWTETSWFTTAEHTTAFGNDLALLGGRALVASWGDGSTLLTGCGGVYRFERDDAGTPADPFDDVWVEAETYLPVARTNQDDFGERPVALHEDEILIGSKRTVYGYRAGEPCAAFVGPRPGVGLNVECLASATVPALGGEWRLEIDTGAHPLPMVSILIGMDRPRSPGLLFRMFGPYRELLVDLVTGYEVFTDQLLADPGGVDAFVYQVPPEPALIGLQIFLQGGVLGGGQGYLTNALNAVVGF